MSPWKSLVPIWHHLATDLGSATVQKADRLTVDRRCNHDAKSFLSRDCPSLAKTVYRSLETGQLEPNPYFRYHKGRPIFLRKLFRVLYDSEGRLRSNASATPALIKERAATLRAILQLTGVFYKVEAASSSHQNEKAIATFVATQYDIAKQHYDWDYETEQIIEKASRVLNGQLKGFRGERPLLTSNPYSTTPRHGAGAVYEKLRQWEKYDPCNHHDYARSPFFQSDTSFLNWNDAQDTADSVSPCRELPKARLSLVPKDARGPRVIAVEETYNQYLKLGLMDAMYSDIQRHPWTRNTVRFDDQEINRFRAKVGSETGAYATMDLAEASDRVTKVLVRRLFRRMPEWQRVLLETACSHVDLPDGSSVELHSFASMGSATCFPVESLVFWALSVAVCDHFDVSVFGDDIVLPTEDYARVARIFHKVGFVINDTKSYHKGSFRESCGGDYWHGEDVSIVRYRRFPDQSRQGKAGAISFLNNFTESFGAPAYRLLQHLDAEYGYIPRSNDWSQRANCVVSDHLSANDVFLKGRWNSKLQRYEHKLCTFKPACRVITDMRAYRRALIEPSASTPFEETSSATRFDDTMRFVRAWGWHNIVL